MLSWTSSGLTGSDKPGALGGFGDSSLQDYLARTCVSIPWSVKPLVRETAGKVVVPVCYLVASAKSYRSGTKCLGLTED